MDCGGSNGSEEGGGGGGGKVPDVEREGGDELNCWMLWLR